MCLSAGEYRVGIKFNDSHIPDSPYKVFVTPANKDAHKVTVGQLPDAGVQVSSHAGVEVSSHAGVQVSSHAGGQHRG